MHCFGAVLGFGSTKFRGPYSYAIICLDLTDDCDHSIGDQDSALEVGDYIQVLVGPLSINVRCGRIALMVYAFRQE